MTVIDQLHELFNTKGHTGYFGEAVTEREHALQCAYLAVRANAEPSLIAAALLHDVGHLLHHLPENIATQGIDAQHELGGATWLAQYFPSSIVDPIRLHVSAKRYLCAVEPTYLPTLSMASRLSLQLQGGPMTAAEIAQFTQEPHSSGAIVLRYWDDQAKSPHLLVPDFDNYRSLLESLLLTSTPCGTPHD